MPRNQEWILRRRTPDDFIREHPELDPVVARILYARKFDSTERIRDFLSTEGTIQAPWLLAGMSDAVERIERAIAEGERIAVYGDFDVDGVTATVLLTSILQNLGARVLSFIPDRFEDGYGLNSDALDRLQAQGITLCITVDCGIRSVDEVDYAQLRGVDMIVTDHHSLPETLPRAYAVVNPRRPDSSYAFTELTGVGVAFQLARALRERLAGAPPDSGPDTYTDQYLDLVALGTIADVAPLEGENRTLVRWGLNRLRSAPRPGLVELAALAGIELATLDSTDVAFRIAPRLNAAGRIENATIASQLLMAPDARVAGPLAKQLDEINRDRQQLLEAQVSQARDMVDAADLPSILFIEGPDYHEGIVGLVASRLREHYYRPVLVLRSGEGTARGSARSVEGFHITRALESCRDILIRFGGHAQAAGFTLETARVPEMHARLLDYADQHLNEHDLVPRLLVDAIVSLNDLSEDTPRAISVLGPFGQGNPEPVLATLGARVMDVRRIGSGGKHLRLDISQDGTPRTCVAFRQGDAADWIGNGDRIDLVYRPSLNRWQGRESLQLVVEALRPHGAARAVPGVE
ncbi:MAG: single-stranded-DNA-specific exonuclease RecJ [Chloroflexi bacterium]|nr:single-stranded-DNA-specific exonuclease RecJ [Chloroflexota bacterium]